MTINKFEELIAWQRSKNLCISVYKEFSISKDFGFNNQIQRASVSIMNNIAEGFERNGNKEFIHFLSIAKASCGESKSQSYRAFDKKLITVEQHLKLNEMLELEKNKIGAMMNYLINCEIKGLKFK